jgi:hypothetical protein
MATLYMLDVLDTALRGIGFCVWNAYAVMVKRLKVEVLLCIHSLFTVETPWYDKVKSHPFQNMYLWKYYTRNTQRNLALTQNVLGELYFYGECIYSMLWLCADNVMFGASVKDVMSRNMIFVVMLLTIMPLLNTIKILSNLKWSQCPRVLHVRFVCAFGGGYIVTT